MHIFANGLRREFVKLGIDVKMIAPTPTLGLFKRSAVGLGKWLGYIDRFILFPRELRAAAANADVIQICDHGSSMYATMVKNKPIVVTCHDMLAVRGALGEVGDCPASLFGRLLQRWICRGMESASLVACVSRSTFEDARRILKSDGNIRVVLNGLIYPFRRLRADEVDRRLAGIHGIEQPFILHVGSNLARKNREGVLRIFRIAADRTDLQLVFVGAALTEKLLQLAEKLQVSNRIVQIVKPDVEIVEALYNRATALLFPSRYEGFGWPPIEAQACGCPVVGSDIPPLVEVLGQSAILKPLEDETGMAESIVRLSTDREYHQQMQQLGLKNVSARYKTSRMIEEYVSLYRELLCQS